MVPERLPNYVDFECGLSHLLSTKFTAPTDVPKTQLNPSSLIIRLNTTH